MADMQLATSEQPAFFDTNGYLAVKGLFPSQEIKQLWQEAHDLIARLQRGGLATDATWQTVRQSNARTALAHCHDVQFHSAAFTRLISDPRLLAVATRLIGPNVQLHHTKLFIKPPENGSPFPMHQDYHYFPHEKNSMIAAIIHLDDAPVEKGCLRVVPASHKLGPIATSAGDHSLSANEYPIEKATPVPCRAGDVVFFSYLTIHGSGINASDQPRTTLLVQMRDPTDPPLKDIHQSRGQGTMLAGIDPLASQHGMAWQK